MWAKNFKICFLYSDTSVCPSIENQSFPMFFYKKRVSWPRNIWAGKLKLSSSLHNFIKSSKHTAAADDAPPCAHEWTRPRRQADGREDGRCWTWQPPPTDPATCTSAGCGSSDDDSTTTGALELAMVAPLQRAANAGLTDDAASLVSRTRRAMLKRKKVRCCDYLHACFSRARIVASNRHTMLLVHRMRRTRRHSLQQLRRRSR